MTEPTPDGDPVEEHADTIDPANVVDPGEFPDADDAPQPGEPG